MRFGSWPAILLLIALAGCGLPRAEKGATCRAVEAGQPVPQVPSRTEPVSYPVAENKVDWTGTMAEIPAKPHA